MRSKVAAMWVTEFMKAERRYTVHVYAYARAELCVARGRMAVARDSRWRRARVLCPPRRQRPAGSELWARIRVSVERCATAFSRVVRAA